jgi:hypothetical protein
MTSRFVKAAFLAVGLLNLMPIVGVAGAARLESLYGVVPDSPDLELLLRHRAVLLGLVGAVLAAAAWHPPLRATAAILGIVSMGAFVALALPVRLHGPEIARVFWADVAGLALLLAAVGVSEVVRRSA